MSAVAAGSPAPIQPGDESRPGLRARHPVAAFVVRRVAAGLATLLVASFLIYAATEALPGNVATVVLGKNATPQAVRTLDHQLNQNRPLLSRYGSWLGGVVTGDLGQSAVELAQGAKSAPVTGMIGTPLRNSFILAALTILLLFPLSLALGVLAGVRAGRPADYAVSIPALVIGAFPEFVIATFMILIFFSALDLLPPVALIAPGQTPFTQPKVLVLPVLTLLLITSASAIRQIRAGMIEVLDQDYIETARLNGIPSRRVLWRYAIRNAMAPSVQIFAQNIQYLIGGIIIVESVFNYPGIGLFLVNAVSTRDVTEVAAVALIVAAVYILVNVLADLIVVFLVPKLRTGLS
jgi:peptide/nickel transport system permease protein